MTKVYIDAGHGGSDPGAVGHVVERDANLVVAKACKEYLDAHGVNTKICRTSNKTNTSINSMTAAANNWGADYYISCHANAGGGVGFEAYYTVNGGEGKTLAKNIEIEVKELGQKSRGLKTKRNGSGSDYFGVIRLTNMPAVICEGFFVDNETDAKKFDTTAEQKKLGYAYARGVLKTAGIKDKGYSGGESASSGSTSSGGGSTGKLTLDGKWGKNTTKKTQKVMGTTQDGIVSGQLKSCEKYCLNMLDESWQWNDGDGSPMVKAIQDLLDVKKDGHMGKNTIKAMQKMLKKKEWYTGEIDGKAGWKTVDGWQRYINSRL